MDTIQEAIRKGPQIPPQILVMEDELSVAKGLEMVLTEEGYGVDLAMTGYSALEKFNQNPFDLLVADLRLPDIDGLEVIKQVKEERPETEAIVITGYPSVASAVESVRIGVSDYLRKPFTDDEFKGAVRVALKRKEKASVEELIVETEKGRLIQKQEVIRVLDRTSRDYDFWRALMKKGSKALEGYRLSPEAKAAIVVGDVEWLKKHVGELSNEQLTFVYKAHEKESW